MAISPSINGENRVITLTYEGNKIKFDLILNRAAKFVYDQLRMFNIQGKTFDQLTNAEALNVVDKMVIWKIKDLAKEGYLAEQEQIDIVARETYVASNLSL